MVSINPTNQHQETGERLAALQRLIHQIDILRKGFKDCIMEFEDWDPGGSCGEWAADLESAETKLINYLMDNRDLVGMNTRAVTSGYTEPWVKET